MAEPQGFAYAVRGNDVVLTHRGAPATVLRGRRAQDFLSAVADGAEPQPLMARLTGSYRRGNERAARQHPRNAPVDR